MKDYTQKAKQFQHGEFLDTVRYPSCCRKLLCQFETPADVLKVHLALVAACNAAVCTFKHRVDAHMVLACEVEQLGMPTQVVFAEMIVGIGRSGFCGGTAALLDL